MHIFDLLSPEQKARAEKQYNIPVKIDGKIVSYRCFDGGCIWHEIFRNKVGNYERTSLTIGDVLQLAGLPVTFDEHWNIQITAEIEPYYMQVNEIIDLNDSGKLKSWRQVKTLLSTS